MDIKTNVRVAPLNVGITIIMLNFAEYFARQQYSKFINLLEGLEELNDFESNITQMRQ